MFLDDKVKNLVQMLSSLPKDLSPVLRQEEYILQLTQQMEYLDQFGDDRRPPFYDEECTPVLRDIVAPFLSAFRVWKINHKEGKAHFHLLFKKIPLKDILLVMGQRQTSASINDENGLPPLKDHLLVSFNECHKHTLSVGARAWCKHANRSENSFWGDVKGNDAYKNKSAQLILQRLLTEYTWWNVFEHYKHGVVYEVRVTSGHGARWAANGKVFIGLLEPFVEA
ncbi:hypothetical protein BKI52_18660 [marine bacterium AO1-C]|nr:hypothetical protein BKI52_18660 [marine bacterium AO1-C]